MSLICEALSRAHDNPESAAHYLFHEPSMSRPANPPVLRNPDAWRRDPDEPFTTRPAKVVADNADGTQQVAYLRGTELVVDDRCSEGREQFGCWWAMVPGLGV